MNRLTHFNAKGEAVMVDVASKEVTERVAIAKGKIVVSKEIMTHVKAGSLQKGDVLGIARVAGIMAVKKTSDLIPLCHPLFISQCHLDFELEVEACTIEVICTVKINHQTGVEMEALTGVNVALLTIYDMCKALCKKMMITNVHLAYKSGGKSGEFNYEA